MTVTSNETAAFLISANFMEHHCPSDNSASPLLNGHTSQLHRLIATPHAYFPNSRNSNRNHSSDAVGRKKSQWMIINSNQQEGSSTLRDDNAALKARLGAEMREKHLLDAKNRELHEKIVDSTCALKTTGDLLEKVHMQIAELKAKVDARENQLHESLRLNKSLATELVYLEHRIADVQTDSERHISAQDEELSELEMLQMQLQSERDAVWRENFLLNELNSEQLDSIESKDRKISNLEKHSFSLQEVISHMQKMSSSDTYVATAPLSPQPATEKPSKLRFNKWLS